MYNFHFPFFIKYLIKFLISVILIHSYCRQFRNMEQYKEVWEISHPTTQRKSLVLETLSMACLIGKCAHFLY